MRLKSLQIQGFRSYKDFEITFAPGLTTFVGENSVGKSTVAIALIMLFNHTVTSGDLLTSPWDYPYGIVGPVTIRAIVDLSAEEVNQWIVDKLRVPSLLNAPAFEDWSRRQGQEVMVTLRRPGPSPMSTISWGDVHFRGPFLSVGDQNFPDGEQFQWSAMVPEQNFEERISSLRGTPGRAPHAMGSQLGERILERFKVIAEFRTRADTNRPMGSVESLAGGETAGVLLTLKNHPESRERARYARIVEAFHQFFPRYWIEAVTQQPGSQSAEVQFYEEEEQNPIPLGLVSAGVHEILTLLTNIVGREGLVVFIEHPEQHLHPHAIRSLMTLFREASERNQIIVVTHDPYFVESWSSEGIRRFWWTKSEGTRALGPESSIDPRMMGQIRTTLSELKNREIVFARAVLLVEDESQKDFLAATAPTLGYALDTSGISIIAVGGADGYRPYLAFLNSLRIPYTCLKDLSWGDPNRYPGDRFFSLGMELEAYLEQHGLREKKEEAAREMGQSKRRLAGVVGERLGKDEIPALFDEVLKAVIQQATGDHASTG